MTAEDSHLDNNQLIKLVGPLGFEPRSTAPQAARIPSYPTDPHVLDKWFGLKGLLCPEQTHPNGAISPMRSAWETIILRQQYLSNPMSSRTFCGSSPILT